MYDLKGTTEILDIIINQYQREIAELDAAIHRYCNENLVTQREKNKGMKNFISKIKKKVTELESKIYENSENLIGEKGKKEMENVISELVKEGVGNQLDRIISDLYDNIILDKEKMKSLKWKIKEYRTQIGFLKLMKKVRKNEQVT